MRNLLYILFCVLVFVGCETLEAATPQSTPITFAVPMEITPVEDAPESFKFSTLFKNATKSRSHNISLAAQKINGKIVPPGEEFSFNDAVGPTTKKNGFMLGRIFFKGRDAKGYGGGVCQVSSTLYNAALSAKLEITERHPHSKPVKYVEKDKDAATSFGKLDFKFKNNNEYPIIIKTIVEKEKVTVILTES